MKYLFTSIIALLLLSGPAIQANAEPVFDGEQVISALKAGNASALAEFFDANIVLSVNGETGTYSKTQATQVVRKFFADNVVTGFERMHNGSSGGASKMFIGTLSTQKGKFRVDVFYKEVNGKPVIQRLKFDKD